MILESIDHAARNVGKYGEGSSRDDGSKCADGHQYEIEPCCKSEQLGKTNWFLSSIVLALSVHFKLIILFFKLINLVATRSHYDYEQIK